MPVNLVSGINIIKNSVTLFKGLGKKALIITGKNSAKLSGALDDVTSLLSGLRINYTIFDDISENPYISICKSAGDMARRSKADFIIGIGGGSSLDAAKAAAVFATNPTLSTNELFETKFKNHPLKIVLIGTTAGTGSEITKISVLTIDQTGHKKALSHDSLYAKIAFADPRYTYSVPKETTISTALDAFSHAVEGYFSPTCTDFPDFCARIAIPMLWKSLLFLCNNYDNYIAPDNSIRNNLYFGSLWAGLVLNSCGTAYPHPFGYVLTEDYKIPHGRACTAFLPSLVARAQTFGKDKYNLFLNLINCSFDEFKTIIDTLTDVDVEISYDEFENYLRRWTDLKNFRNTPGNFNIALARELFKSRFKIIM